MKMTHASVFSGIGGPEIAAMMLGWDNVFHCEINPFCRAVLDYWYPNSKSYEDITKTDFTEWRGKVEVLTGGFPCQPFSYAGQRRGAEDDRYLWPHMFRCIDQVRPTWVVAENVAGILTMVEQGEVSPMESQGTLFDEGDGVRRHRLVETFTLQRICDDLEGHGYEVQPVLVPACAVGAPHRRDRVFIVAMRVVADTDLGADGRAAREDAGESGAERLQERHEVQKPYEPGQVRREGERTADPADTISKGLERQDESGCGQGGKRLHLRRDGTRCGVETIPNPDIYRGREVDEHLQPELADGAEFVSNGGQRNVADTASERTGRVRDTVEEERPRGCDDILGVCSGLSYEVGERWAAFPTVSPVHRGNDGLPFPLDDLTIPASKWRTESLKAYGNAIVPQVMYEIFRSIEIVERENL